MSKTLFTHVNLFDGLHNKVSQNVWMLVNDDTGKFVKLGTRNEPKADRTVNMHDKYVMPGLINVHTHMTDNPWDMTGHWPNVVEATVNAVKNLRHMLKSGVTYVRSCGVSNVLVDTTLNKLQRVGKLKKVPRIDPAGLAMTMTGGHGDDGHNTMNLVDSPDEMRKAVRTNFKYGAHCTKVMATGGVASPQDNMNQPQLKVPEMKVAVEETHSKHGVVAAHAEGAAGIMNALKAGVDSVEHGFYSTDEELHMMLNKGTYLTPTLIAAYTILYHKKDLPKRMVDKDQACVNHLVKTFKKAYKMGVKFTLGTDAGSPCNSFYYTPVEFQLLVNKVGMSNFDALSTSRHSAELLKLKDYGTLQAGKYADFLVLDKNPLADVKAVQQKDKAVYQHGERQF